MRRFMLLTVGLVLVLGLAGCRESETGTSVGPPDENQIARLSTPAEPVADDLRGLRLEPLPADTVASASNTNRGCAFASDGAALLVAVGANAWVRVDGRLVQLLASGPVGPSGAFFESERLNISIGRSEAGAAYNQAGAAPARASITRRSPRAQVEMTGIWSCRQ